MKFDMSKAWSEATSMIGANREVLAIVAGLFFFLPGVILSLTTPDFPPLESVDEAAIARFTGVVQAFYADYWWLVLISFMAQLVGYLSLLALLRDDSHPTVGAAIQTGIKGILPALGTYLLFVIGATLALTLLIGVSAASGIGVLIGLASLIGVVGMIYVSVKFSLAAPVIAIDRVSNPIRVLQRSWQLTKGNSVRIFAFFALIIVAYIVLALVIGMIVGALGALTSGGVLSTVLTVISSLVGAAVTVLFVAVLAAIHRQLSGPSTSALNQTFG
ncbi:hypothetical protein GCM10009127_26850 [Alteraurantiacibacter aestuarii]|uniref:Glycerophosphoryl diester phosphodiesterase membrane domain-containing protein n=1 Tax=Alteraurantiacibacter aestuarii TaxID=650004 RepID=A0A844ZP24_9SPHN|nr:EscU/YscU/HrcU family type III secretion system export apparatus switch protein [Alteraurantiacibacter aestuarii]MXO88796.1 hypothetical protein [Alteraurantiacibacter aestuarii]